MSCSLNHGVTSGRGLQFPFNRSFVFKNRTGGAIVAGRVYMVAEGLTVDDADVTVPANQGDNGALANVVLVPATAAGVTTFDGNVGFPTYVLALEAVADDGLFRAAVEAYYVDAEVVTTSQPVPARAHLYVNATEQLANAKAATAPRQPIHGRLLEVATANNTTTRKVHFCGLPGGFGVGGIDT